MPEGESVRYTADLTNLLSAYAFKQNGRFVYLSSEVVYGRSYSSDIHETEPASSKSFQAMAILQGENICKSYRDTREMDTRFCASIICMIFHGKERPTITHVSR